MLKKSFELFSVQDTFVVGNPEANLEGVVSLTERLSDQFSGPAILLLPELFPSGYDPAIAAADFAEEQDGLTFLTMSKLALKHRIHIAYGYAEDGGAGRRYNSLMLLGPDGKALAHYRKIHLTQGEKSLFTGGTEIVVAETALGRIGLMICWDLAFPEIARNLTLRGAELLIVPTAWDRPHAGLYRKFASVRALENTVFLATSNHLGRISGVDYFGESLLYGPTGNLLAKTEDACPDIARAIINPDVIRIAREGYYTMLADRRGAVYEKNIISGGE
jgi:5-aminopentanamidase